MKMSRYLLLIVFSALSAVMFGQYNDQFIENWRNEAYNYKKSGNLEKAAELFLRAAQNGDAISQYEIGNFYAEGRGVKQDNAQAFKWLKESADQKNPNALFVLGLSYCDNIFTPKDIDLGIKMIKEAAELDLPSAQYYMGRYYYLNPIRDPKLSKRNIGGALYWFEKASQHNHIKATAMLSNIYAIDLDDSEEKGMVYWIKVLKLCDLYGVDIEEIEQFCENENQYVWQGAYSPCH